MSLLVPQAKCYINSDWPALYGLSWSYELNKAVRQDRAEGPDDNRQGPIS